MGEQNQKISILDAIFGIFQKSVEFTKKYSIVDLLKGLFALVFSTAIILLFLNPSFILDKYDEFKDKQHTEKVEKRLDISPKIQLELDKLLFSTSANRAFVVEFHNGTNNLNGLPFLYGDVTYEQVNGVEYIGDLYYNIPLARFPISNVLMNRGYWYGSLDELAEIDKRLKNRVEVNDCTWMALILLKGKDQYLGIIGLTYKDIENVRKEDVGKHLRTAAINTIALLDN